MTVTATVGRGVLLIAASCSILHCWPIDLVVRFLFSALVLFSAYYHLFELAKLQYRLLPYLEFPFFFIGGAPFGGEVRNVRWQ